MKYETGAYSALPVCLSICPSNSFRYAVPLLETILYIDSNTSDIINDINSLVH